MSLTICIAANTLYYPEGGGHMWAYLNWALGFKSNGCRVIWLERVKYDTSSGDIRKYIIQLKEKLSPYGLAEDVALCAKNTESLPEEKLCNCIDIDTAASISDLLINQHYNLNREIVKLFRRTALLDIDPGLLQMWCSRGEIHIAPHDFYFTIGETVGQPGAYFPDCGIPWQYTPPCVSLDAWPVTLAPENAPLTTVTHWAMHEWEKYNGELYSNDKRTGYLPFFELPRYSPLPLELAILLGEWDQDERFVLQEYGWRVSDSHTVASSPEKYKSYIQRSYGEFSCVKPSCIRLQNAWISDRSLCYLASGKPVIVQHTGPSRFLPDSAGLLRFKNFDEAIKCIEEAEANYDKHCKLARALAEEYFDAKKVTTSLLERVL
jgi:hypothetical protein